jgi:hypothetical protein
MITLRTFHYEVPKDPDTLLLHLRVHTTATEFVSNHFPIYGWMLDASNTWFGRANSTNRTFTLIRNREVSGFPRPSAILIKGEIKFSENKSLVTIDLQPTGFVVFNNIFFWLLTIGAMILNPNEFLIEHWGFVLLWVLLFSTNYISLMIDLNKTTMKLSQYFTAQTSTT